METQPSASTKPCNESRVGPIGLNAAIFTVTSPSAPVILMLPLFVPFGTLVQSTVTQRRPSFSILPPVSLNEIHGEPAAAENSNGVLPLLKTPTQRTCRLKT